jgi:ADP-ribose pyrophosphatase
VLVREPDEVSLSDPGITNANLQVVEIAIDEDALENQSPKPSEEDAAIETLLLPIDNLKRSLDQFVKEGLYIDSRLYHFAIGLDFARREVQR